MTTALTILAVAESEPVGPSNAGLGAVVLTLAIGALLVWVGYLFFARRRKARPEETPANLQPFLSDDELETNRVTRVLGAAVIAAAVVGIALPVYYINESGRQARAEEALAELDVEEGEKWWEKFECTACHGPAAGGGGAAFTEARSDLPVSWAAPSLNDVFYRYSEEEVRVWIVWGRQGTPMAPAGLEGGGAMTVQEVDQVIAFLRHEEISQNDVLLEIEGVVSTALQRVLDGAATTEIALEQHRAELWDIQDAQKILDAHAGALAADSALPNDVPLDEALDIIISSPGTCTDESAAMAGTTCSREGQDTDRDGIADDAERAISSLAAIAFDTLVTRSAPLGTIEVNRNAAFDIAFDPGTGFSNADVTGNPIADMDELEAFREELGFDLLSTSLIAERREVFEGNTLARIAFLEDALADKRWIPTGVSVTEHDDGTRTAVYADLARSMSEANGVSVSPADARRAVGLFNGYCARCHTAGYSAGVATEQEPGSGAWGPSLTDGRSVIQFPSAEDQVAFIIRGSNFGENYGLNGLGSGRMPGFGQILTLEDIELIVMYERSL